MMHWILLCRDWNTLESVRKVHSFFEGTALVFFALLVLFDVLGHLTDEKSTRGKLFARSGLTCFCASCLVRVARLPIQPTKRHCRQLKIRNREARSAAWKTRQKAVE